MRVLIKTVKEINPENTQLSTHVQPKRMYDDIPSMSIQITLRTSSDWLSAFAAAAAAALALSAFSLSSSITLFRMSSMLLLFNCSVCVEGSSAPNWKSNNWLQGESFAMRLTVAGRELGSISSSATCCPGDSSSWSCGASAGGTGGSPGWVLSWLEAKLVFDWTESGGCVTGGAGTEDGSSSWCWLGYEGTAAASFHAVIVCVCLAAGCWPAAVWVTTTGTLTL